MNENKIQLKPSCILMVPLQTYEENFTFIVNNNEFKTNRFISDLLSPTISRIHINDPTFDVFTINTHQPGNFSHILNLINFKQNNLPENELPFIIEVLNLLGNDSVDITTSTDSIEITNDNVFTLIKKHEINSNFFSKRLLAEITYISSHFFELCESQKEELKCLSIDTLYQVLTNEQLQIKDEDQLLNFINELYSTDVKYSILYNTVYFINVTSASIKEFVNIYNYDEMTNETWKRLSERLSEEIQNSKAKSDNDKIRYKEQKRRDLQFMKQDNKDFAGIINHLRTNSSNQIENEIEFSASSINGSSYQPSNVALSEDRSKIFESADKQNSWICLDFKEHRVIPTAYTIMSSNCSGSNWHHPRSWVFEGSADNSSWVPLDSQSDCSYLNGSGLVHTFSIQNQLSNESEFKYIRIRSTGKDWANYNYLIFDSLEIYGTLI